MDTAILAGVFALVGVLLGGLLRAIEEFVRDRRDRRRAMIASARLVAAELRHSDAAIGWGIQRRKWWMEELVIDDWRQHAQVLTGLLPPLDWDVVRDANDEVRISERTRSHALASDEPMLGVEAQELGKSRKAIKDAIAVLEEYDGDPRDLIDRSRERVVRGVRRKRALRRP